MLGPGRGTRTPSVRPPNGILYAVEIQNYCGRSRIQLNRMSFMSGALPTELRDRITRPDGIRTHDL